MAWNFSSNMPIYVQIMDVLKQRIVSEEMKPGEKIPSVRELAQDAGVNPNTMQRALTELERENLLYTVRTSGRFVTTEKKRIEDEKQRLARGKILELVSSLEKLGFSRTEVKELLEKAVETDEKAETREMEGIRETAVKKETEETEKKKETGETKETKEKKEL